MKKGQKASETGRSNIARAARRIAAIKKKQTNQRYDKFKVELLTMYDVQRMPPRAIMASMKEQGHIWMDRYTFSKWLHINTKVRNRGEARKGMIPKWGRCQVDQSCEACKQPFRPAGVTQQCCKTCIPNSQAWYRWKSYGLTQPGFELLWHRCQGRCEGCRCEISDKTHGRNMLCIDHDHVTGKIRGILCSACNHALGLVRDNRDTLRQLATYLDTHM